MLSRSLRLVSSRRSPLTIAKRYEPNFSRREPLDPNVEWVWTPEGEAWKRRVFESFIPLMVTVVGVTSYYFYLQFNESKETPVDVQAAPDAKVEK